jgi:hypothetical protein
MGSLNRKGTHALQKLHRGWNLTKLIDQVDPRS